MLSRLRAQPGVVAAVLASVLLATTLLAAGPVLATAVAEGGLRADLAEATPAETGIEVEVRTTADRAAATAEAVLRVLAARLGDRVVAPDVLVSAGTIRLAGQPEGIVTPVVVAEDGLGVTPAEPLLTTVEEAAEEAPVPALAVAVHADALDALGHRVGDVVTTADGVAVHLRSAVAPADAGDRRWWDDPLARDGVVPGVDFTRVGPLVVDTPADLVTLLGEGPQVAVRVRTLPVLDLVTPATLGQLGRDAAAAAERIDLVLEDEDLGDTWRIEPALADAARAATVSLAATRAAVVATVGQVAVLAIYTLGLAGRLLRSGREVETMLLRARGATPEQLGRAALREGLVLVLPAVLAAPWMAAVAVRALGLVGVTAGSSLELDPRASTAALGAAAVAGAACLVVLVVPAVTSARRTYASTRGGLGRRSPVGAVQALGLDLALAVVAGIGVWQLRAQGAPLTGAPRGPGDVDPVLVVAPALGLLAGALLVLRLVPGIARVGEHVAGRVRGLVAALGGWQVARRPDAVSRPTLLLVLGVAVGVLATTYGATWRVSQADQAAAAVGADLVVAPDRQVGALADRFVPGVLAGDTAVDRVRPLVEAPVRVEAGGTGGTLVAVDATDPLLVVRDDMAPTVSWSELDVPPVTGLALPEGDELTVRVERVVDPRWPDVDVGLVLVVRDGLGLLHRLEERPVPPGESTAAWSLAGTVAPVDLVAVLVETEAGDLNGVGWAGPELGPDQSFPAPRLALRVGPPTVDGQVTRPSSGWVTDPYGSIAAFPPEHELTEVDADGWRVLATTGVAGPRGRLATLALVHPAAAAPRPDTVPAVVHPDVLAATGRDVGAELVLTTGGAPLRLAVVGTTPLVPGHARAQLPVVVDVDAVAAARWGNDRTVTAPTAWLVALDDVAPKDRRAESERLAGTWGAAPVNAPSVASMAGDEATRRGDPIAIGLVAALTLGALAAAVLAVLGTVTTAVVGVRERAAEFALLQAVGTSLRQLRWWLASEVAVVVVVGVLAGGVLGALLVWAVLPTIALAADGSAAVPAPLVVVPVRTLALAAAVVVGAFTLVPVVLTRVVARAHVAEVLRLGEDT